MQLATLDRVREPALGPTRNGRRSPARPLVFALLAGPATAWLAVFVFAPALVAFAIALFDWRPLSGQVEYVGLANFRALAGDDELWSAAWTTLLYTVFVIPGALLVGLGTALAIRAVRYGRGFYKALYFFPVAATLAASSVAWRWSFQPGGRIDTALGGLLGVENWLADSTFAFVALVLVGIWRESAFAMIFFAAALAAVPTQQVDAARVDGAHWWGRFEAVLWPALRPGMTASIVLVTTHSAGIFDPVAIITGGGPAGATTTLGYLLWERSVLFQDYAGGAVTGLLLLVFLLALTGVQLLAVRNRSRRS